MIPPADTPPLVPITAPGRELIDEALASANDAQVRIERTITGMYEPAPGLASREGVALQAALEAVGLLGESLAAAKAVEHDAATDGLASNIYDARTSLMGAQTSLTQGVHRLAAEGFAAAQTHFGRARTDASDAVSKLQVARANVLAVGN